MPVIGPQCKYLIRRRMLALDKITGRAKGGIARAEVLSPEERQSIARKAAVARWGLEAIRRGNFQEEFGVDVDCYVLDDEQKTAVISQTGMGRALGLSARGNAFPRFLASKAMSKTVGAELREKLENPLKFQWGSGGAEQPRTIVFGFEATLLIDLCKSIITAESQGRLPSRSARIAQQAHIIVGASAKSGITGLVYALTGYNRSTEEVIAAFKLYVQEEAKKYEPEFPSELYAQWHRLYNIPVPVRGKPWHFKYLTVQHVYHPLAKSNGKIYLLLKALKAKGGDRRNKLFQFLNEIGARALRMQLGRVLEMAESSPDREEYEQKTVQRFGGQLKLGLAMPSASSASQPLSGRSPSDAS